MPSRAEMSPSARPPSDWIVRFAPLFPAGGTVLDLAAGSGRHSRYLADRGYRVTTVDRDVSRLTDEPRIDAVEADLEDGGPWPLGARRFDGIVVTNYLHRPLFPHLVAALADGGVLLYETFAVGNEAYGKPSNPDFLLKGGELLAAFSGDLRVVAYEAGYVERPAPAVLQRIAAVRAAGGPIPLPG
jgi:SAM-dependent methyltransferase